MKREDNGDSAVFDKTPPSKCKCCGQHFLRVWYQQHYCSGKCRVKSYRQRRGTKGGSDGKQ